MSSSSSPDYWDLIPHGAKIAVRSDLPDKLLGVRDGFRRYFKEAVEHPIQLNVVPQPHDGDGILPVEDTDILTLAQRRARQLQDQLGDAYDFYVGTEAGLLNMTVDQTSRYLVRTWTVVVAGRDEAWGSSGGLQVPARLIEGLDADQVSFAIPGTRRRGGMVGSLSHGLENRRSATAEATFNALCTLLFGAFDLPSMQGFRL
ncbi:MAG: DUF84 family protein [Acidobacteriota bacterium]